MEASLGYIVILWIPIQPLITEHNLCLKTWKNETKKLF